MSVISLDIPSLRQLRAFEAAARLESVSAAARGVNLSQPGLTQSPNVVIARADDLLTRAKRITPRELARYDWIMPEAGAPRRLAFERLFAGPPARNVSIETTSLAIYGSILAASDRRTLMSRLAAQANESAALAVLPSSSPHLHDPTASPVASTGSRRTSTCAFCSCCAPRLCRQTKYEPRSVSTQTRTLRARRSDTGFCPSTRTTLQRVELGPPKAPRAGDRSTFRSDGMERTLDSRVGAYPYW